MAQLIDSKVFNVGINKDVEPKFLGQGEYIDADNIMIHNSLDGKVGVVTNMPNISDKASSLYSYGTSSIIGTFPDKENNLIYTFIYHGGADHYHRIMSYDIVSGTHEIVLTSSNLPWISTTRIKSCNIVDGVLYWTDGVNEPMKFDTNIGYLEALGIDEYDTNSGYSSSDLVYYNGIVYEALTAVPLTSPPTGTFASNTYWEATDNDEITIDMLTIATRVPSNAPTIDMLSDDGYNPNNILGKFFQFKFRFVFINNQKSVFSPISEVAYSSDDYTSLKLLDASEAKFNAIDITMNGSNSNALVKSVELAVRQGNLGDFYIVDEITIDDTFRAGGDFVYRFYNSGIYTPLSITESNQIFDDIPRVTQTMVYSNNRLFMGNNLVGYAKPTVSYTVDVEYNDMADVDDMYSDTSTDRTVLSDSSGTTLATFFSGTLGYTIQTGDIITIQGSSTSSNFAFGYYSFQIEAGWNAADIINKALLYKVNIKGEELDFLDSKTTVGLTYENDRFNISITPRIHEKTFKSGAWYDVGIEYFDKYGRTNGVLIDPDNYRVYIQTIPERITTTAGSLTDAGAATIKVTIDQDTYAPDWAEYYKIVYSRSKTYSYSIQAVTTEAEDDPNQVGVIVLNINSLQEYNKSSGAKLVYQYEPGDRVRFITYDQGGTGIAKYHDWSDRLYEAEILDSGTDFYTETSVSPDPDLADTDQWIKIFTVDSLWADTDEYTGAVIEIVRQGSELDVEEVIFSESTKHYGISGSIGSKIHLGDTDQVYGSVDAEVTITGDAYIFRRPDFTTDTLDYDLIMESYSISDFRDSEVFDLGRNTAIINRQEESNSASIFYSEKLIPNTSINNLNRFYPDVNFEEFDRRLGDIVHIHDEGDHLILLQKDGVSRVFVERAITYDAQGNANYLGTNASVLSTPIPLTTSNGAVDNKSFISSKYGKYFVDLERGAVVRINANGISEISRIGMNGHFSSLCKSTLKATDNSVNAMYDPLNHEYIVRFVDSDEVWRFSEEGERWISQGSIFVMTHSVYLNNRAFFTNGAELNEINGTGLRNYIVGTGLFDSYIQFVSNIEPTKLKNYLGISIDSSYAPDVRIVTQSIGGKTNQLSTLDQDLDFTEREQIFHASFLRDQYTPNIPAGMSALLSGDTMKGLYAIIKLTITGDNADEDWWIKSADILISKG